VIRRPRTVVPAVLAATALVVGACSSSGSGNPSAQPLPTAVSSLPSKLPKTSTTLTEFMRHGLTTTGSARISVIAHSRRDKLKSIGHETMVNGAVTGLDVTLTSSALHAVRVLLVNSVTYAHLPHGEKGKPWVALPRTGGHKLSAGSRAVRNALATTVPLAAPANIVALVAAGEVKIQGTGVTASVPYARYAVTTQVSKLGKGAAIRAVLLAAHVRSVRLDLRVDGSGRPIVVQWQSRGGGAGAPDGEAQLRDYNRPVHLQAPRATQVSTAD
jgi:hypothetical protein